MNRPALAALLALSIAAAAPAAEGPYRVEEIPLPHEMSPEVSAVAFAPSGRLAAANRHGDVWFLQPDSGRWTRFAHGLHEPLGIIAVSDAEVFVVHKPELTRIVDSDGDGRADLYQTVADGWATTDNWHEHSFGLARDGQGNFVIALGLTDTAGPINTLWPRVPLDFSTVASEKKLSLGPYQGWVIKVTPQGKIIPWAFGFREPCGVGISPDGEIFITDQQGDYIGSSPLIHVQQGKFYGHPASAKWAPGFASGTRLDEDQLAAMRTPETVILPHGSMGGSPGEPIWDSTAGKFGPFAGQVFIGDFTRLISRVDLEHVHGQWQGACFTFLRDAVGMMALAASSGANNLTAPAGAEGKKYFHDVEPLGGTPLRQGNMRMAFAPDGSLYVGQTTRGWGPGDGLQRIVWTGQTPVEIHSMRLAPRGFRLRFTSAMQPAAAADRANYHLSRFRYVYHQHYGSPRVDHTPVDVLEARLNPSGDEVDLVVDRLEPGFIYELQLDGLVSRDGRSPRYPHAYYTLNRTLDGRRYEGRITSGSAAPQAVDQPRDPDPKLGQRVYATFCIQCHRPDGKGGGLPGVGAADFTRPGGVLAAKSDAELADRIARGIEGKTMPPFGYVLSPQQIVDVLAFVRTAYAPTSSENPNP